MRVSILILVGLAAAAAYGADESWKLPLAVKEAAIEKNIQARHNIMGLYPSQVVVDLETGEADYTTAGYCDIAHAVCWTANYLAGASYRYAFLKKSGAPEDQVDAARRRADELFEAIFRCQLVTGVRGLQARGYAIGHGESYEERKGSPKSDVWRQGAGEYQDLRWRGDPSHHNYSDSIHGLGQYYDLAAEGEQKDRCRDAIDRLVGYWVDNDLRIRHFNPKRFTPILGMTDGETLNTRIMMAIAGAKVAHHATGKPQYKAAYDQLIEQYGVRGLESFRTDKNFDDAEHVLCHLENLFRIEDDPELLAAYRKVLDALWANHRNDAHSLFTYIYLSLTPDAPGRDKALREALFSLQTWPTDTTLKPTMSSLNPDLKPPYPVYAAAWDNEYIWKGNLLRPDGWLSRIIVDVAVPKEDPVVIYAIDHTGEVYQSRDGAATAAGWRPIDLTLPSPARAIAAGHRLRKIFVACDDGFYASTTGGQTWVPLNVPPEGGEPKDIQVDPETDNLIYAVRDNATYRSHYKYDRFLGKRWELLEGGLPKWDQADEDIQLKPDTHGVLKSTDGGKTWHLKQEGLDIPQANTVLTPRHTGWVFAGTPAGLYLSKDRGETWETGHLVLQFIKNTRREIGGAAFIDAYWRARYYGLIDEADANRPWQD